MWFGDYVFNYRNSKWQANDDPEAAITDLVQRIYKKAISTANSCIPQVKDKMYPSGGLPGFGDGDFATLSADESIKSNVDFMSRAVELQKERQKFNPASRVAEGGSTEFEAEIGTAEYHHPSCNSTTLPMRCEEVVKSSLRENPVVYLNIGDTVKVEYSLIPPNEVDEKAARSSADSNSSSKIAGVHQSAYSAHARQKEALAAKAAGASGSKSGEGSSKFKAVTMKSGDCLVFGGQNRMVYHGIAEIIPETGPPDLKMTKPGRLMVALK